MPGIQSSLRAAMLWVAAVGANFAVLRWLILAQKFSKKRRVGLGIRRRIGGENGVILVLQSSSLMVKRQPYKLPELLAYS